MGQENEKQEFWRSSWPEGLREPEPYSEPDPANYWYGSPALVAGGFHEREGWEQEAINNGYIPYVDEFGLSVRWKRHRPIIPKFRNTAS